MNKNLYCVKKKISKLTFNKRFNELLHTFITTWDMADSLHLIHFYLEILKKIIYLNDAGRSQCKSICPSPFYPIRKLNRDQTSSRFPQWLWVRVFLFCCCFQFRVIKTLFSSVLSCFSLVLFWSLWFSLRCLQSDSDTIWTSGETAWRCSQTHLYICRNIRWWCFYQLDQTGWRKRTGVGRPHFCSQWKQ